MHIALLYDIEGHAFHDTVLSLSHMLEMRGHQATRIQSSSLPQQAKPKGVPDYDAVYAPTYAYTQRIKTTPWLASVPYIATVPDHVTWKSGQGKLALEATLGVASVVFATNERLLHELQKTYPYYDKFRLVTYGVDPSLFCYDAWSTENARNRAYNDKVKLAGGVLPEVMWGWVGSTKYWPEVKRHDVVLSVATRMPKSCAFLDVDAAKKPRVERTRMADDVYRVLDICVCASSSEGTCKPLLEAAACGCVVVSTPVGVAPELLRGHPNLLLPDTSDSAELENALLHTLTDLACYPPAALAGIGQQLAQTVSSEWSASTRFMPIIKAITAGKL